MQVALLRLGAREGGIPTAQLYASTADAYGNLYSTGQVVANGRLVIADDAGNVYVIGESTGSDDSFDVATVKYDAKGNQVLVSRYYQGECV